MNINAETKLLGAIGYPLKQSRSPMVMNRLSELLNQNYIYAMYEFEPKKLEDAIKGLKALGARGFNVTMPYKQRIMDYLDDISDEAEKLGAVNTVLNENGKLTGFNTDYYGFVQALKLADINIEGKSILCIGAGSISGCARLALAKQKAKNVLWLNRTVEKAKAVAEKMNREFPGMAEFGKLDERSLTEGIKNADVVINITSVGMSTSADKILPFDASVIDGSKDFFDVLYSPIKTPLLSEAQKKGAKTANGLYMFLNQARKAFEIWTGASVTDSALDEIKQLVLKDLSGQPLEGK